MQQQFNNAIHNIRYVAIKPIIAEINQILVPINKLKLPKIHSQNDSDLGINSLKKLQQI